MYFIHYDKLRKEQAENTRLQELNRDMVELIRFFEMDINFMLGDKRYLPKDYSVDWLSRKVKIHDLLTKVDV